jgi:hypothetical protein
MTPAGLGRTPVEVQTIDEYVYIDPGLSWLRSGVLAESVGITPMSLFNRYCAWRRTHPMSGGVMPVRRDRVDDYLSLRKHAFGFELVPLPAACNCRQRTAWGTGSSIGMCGRVCHAQPTPPSLSDPVAIEGSHGVQAVFCPAKISSTDRPFDGESV